MDNQSLSDSELNNFLGASMVKLKKYVLRLTIDSMIIFLSQLKDKRYMQSEQEFAMLRVSVRYGSG